MSAVLPSRPTAVSAPLAADPGDSEHRQAEVGEEGDRGVQVADGDADVIEFDRHGPQGSAKEV